MHTIQMTEKERETVFNSLVDYAEWQAVAVDDPLNEIIALFAKKTRRFYTTGYAYCCKEGEVAKDTNTVRTIEDNDMPTTACCDKGLVLQQLRWVAAQMFLSNISWYFLGMAYWQLTRGDKHIDNVAHISDAQLADKFMRCVKENASFVPVPEGIGLSGTLNVNELRKSNYFCMYADAFEYVYEREKETHGGEVPLHLFTESLLKVKSLEEYARTI